MLTAKQHELLVFLDRHLRESGTCPSFEEMKQAVRLKSKSGIHRLINALEERRFIRRLPNRARALEVIRLPEGLRTQPKEVSRAAPKAPLAVIHAAASMALPLYGRIAAGLAIEAVRDTTRMVDVPASMVGRGNHYVLEVSGDSMVDAGILDGDLAIIHHSETAHDGEIVVALLDDGEVTLKRLYRRGQKIALEPANKNYRTHIYDPSRVRVQGSLTALLRRYS